MNRQMKNIHIDFDKTIFEYIRENTNNKIDITDAVNNIVEKALEYNELSFDNIYISIQSATKEEINKLNLEYRNIDRPTDVLSFPIFEKDEIDKLKLLDENKKIKELELGDIIICLDIVKDHSIEYDTGLIREILYMITHGVCHLLGYDHIEDEDKLKMRDLEEKILNNLGVFDLNE